MPSYVELLKAGKLPRATLFLLTGNDPFIHRDVVSRLTRGLVQEPDLNFLHVRVVDGTRFDEIEAFAEEFPMLSKLRLLWIDGSDRLAPAVRQQLATYLERRPPTTVLVLSCGQAGESRKRSPAKGKATEGPSPEDVAAASGVTVGCEIRVPGPFGQGPDDRAAWLTLDLEKRGLTAAGPARQALMSRLGSSLAELRGEIDKLQAYLGTRTQIQKADVEAVVCRTVVGSMQQLSGLLQKRDADGLLRLYRELLRGGAPAFQIMAYVGAVARTQADVPGLQRLVETEVMAKSGTDAELAVEMLLMQLCHAWPSPEPVMLRPRR